MSIKISDYGYTGKWQGTVVNSTSAKVSSFAAQMKKLTDTMTLTDPVENPTLKAGYDQLSTASKGVLDRMKAGQTDISQDEWTNLCRELKEAGLITESDFLYTRADLRIVPIGYLDRNGNTVLYDSNLMPGGLLEMNSRYNNCSGLSKTTTVNDWSGDPLQYLDKWIESLRMWRSDLASQRNEDGTRRYDDFSPISNNIDSCQKVSNLVKMLMKFC